jgi:hypothetical protein
MTSRLFSLNALFGAVALGFAAYIGWEMVRPARPLPPSRPSARASVTPLTPPARPAPPGAAAWAVIASRNPFSPTRSEAPATAAQAGPVLGLPKPNVFGIVLRDGASLAYIEDPVTKRVAAYRIGDMVAGGTVQKIAADGIVLARPEGALNVRLLDPSKPRPPAPPPSASAAGPAPAPGPGVAGPGPQQTQAPAEEASPPPQPAVVAPGRELPRPPIRRPLPPNLLRRLPQTPPSDDQPR